MKLTLFIGAVGLEAAWGALGIGRANSELLQEEQGKVGPICKSHAERSEDGALNYTETSKSAIDALNTLYNSSEGRWAPEVAWWISGVALQGILDYTLRTGSYEYLDQANDIIEKQKEPLAWWPEGEGLFRADSTDDTAWWALALVRMFDISGDSWCLDTAKTDEEYMYQYWTDGSCGGGLVQSIRTKTYKNAISNQLYALLAASLHNRIPNDTEYLDKAKAAWEWLFASGMLNEDHLFNDGLTKDDDDVCVNNNGTVWTYNQGVILGAATGDASTPLTSLPILTHETELYKATSNTTYLMLARRTADAVLANPSLVLDGILVEPCEEAQSCNHDQQTFKGIFTRYLAELGSALSKLIDEDPYRQFLEANAKMAVEKARNTTTGFFDVSWTGPFEDGTLGTQASALGLLAALI